MGKVSIALASILFGLFLATAVRAQTITIAVLGDSLVQGYGLTEERGFVPQMQGWLNDHELDVELINAGVSGDTTAGGLARVDWTLAADIDALVVSLGGNDVLRGIDPAISKSNLEGILAVATDRKLPVLLVGIIAPQNYGTTYRQEFEAIYPTLANRFQVMLYPNFLEVLMAIPDRQMVLRKFYQADALHPNGKGVAKIVDDMGPSFARLAASVRQ